MPSTKQPYIPQSRGALLDNIINERSQYIFKHIVDAYMQTGMPVGSKTLSAHADIHLSSASIRSIMAELERQELLYAPHISAGRLPTQKGLRLYIDGLMEVGSISNDERHAIDIACQTTGHSTDGLLEQTGQLLSGLSNCVGLVTAPKTNKPIKQIQFVKIQPLKILVILVMKDDTIENRILDLDHDIPQSALDQACNFINAQLTHHDIDQARAHIARDIQQRQTQLDHLAQDLVERGLALPFDNQSSHLIVRGQSHLLNDLQAIEQLEQVKNLLSMLEEKQTTENLLKTLEKAQGVQIYLGTEHETFSHSGWSIILSPYRVDNKVIGAIGVVGPTRINYGKIIPIVDYTAKVIQRFLENK